MALTELIHEDNTSLDNAHVDVLQTVRFSAALALSANQIGVNNFQTERDWIEHVEEDIEPADADLPFASYVFWFESVGLNRRLMSKYKDAGGTVRTRNMGLYT